MIRRQDQHGRASLRGTGTGRPVLHREWVGFHRRRIVPAAPYLDWADIMASINEYESQSTRPAMNRTPGDARTCAPLHFSCRPDDSPQSQKVFEARSERSHQRPRRETRREVQARGLRSNSRASFAQRTLCTGSADLLRQLRKQDGG